MTRMQKFYSTLRIVQPLFHAVRNIPNQSAARSPLAVGQSLRAAFCSCIFFRRCYSDPAAQPNPFTSPHPSDDLPVRLGLLGPLLSRSCLWWRVLSGVEGSGAEDEGAVLGSETVTA